MRNIKTNHRVERAAREFLAYAATRLACGGNYDAHIDQNLRSFDSKIGAKLAIELRCALAALDR